MHDLEQSQLHIGRDRKLPGAVREIGSLREAGPRVAAGYAGGPKGSGDAGRLRWLAFF
jgi:hypothetical protein